jgi:putative hydrolase of the HAD superfamily
MSSEQIRAVIFDMGGTLEDLYYDDDIRLRATPGIQAILAGHGLDARLEVARLYDMIAAGLRTYQDWREASEVELPSARVWSEFVFGDRGFPAERLAEISEKLSFFYDTNYYVRAMRPDVPVTLARLKSAGFQLGVISNVVSLGQVPHNLHAYGLDHYFEVVVTSSGFGYRKPSPRIFWEAARQLDLPPAACAYVGDTISRDVAGARRAGYGLSIQIKSFLTSRSDRESDVEAPDAVVRTLEEVVDVVISHNGATRRGTKGKGAPRGAPSGAPSGATSEVHGQIEEQVVSADGNS